MDKAVHQLDALSSLAETQGVGPAREDWRRQRRRMEAAEEKHTPRAVKERRHWVAFRRLLALFGVGLRLCGLYERGVRNALDIKLKRPGASNFPVSRARLCAARIPEPEKRVTSRLNNNVPRTAKIP